ncbi:unnamed protein product [Hyaloperonospora brassicae]|uniref:Uncharacterized protein n=1 Tax=Hyaloperonospora brassicae TaxID=162125 RepID=A0AAV0T3E3_HYABA|nr:unnamed protein product [Hyaloperonospora brassicae]
MSHWKDTQKSIDEELDDEFAALDAESDTNSQAKADGSCSGSSSSDSSDSSSSDESAGVGDDSMTGNGTNADDNTYVDPVDEKVEQTKGQHIENDGDSGAQPSLLVDKDVVSLAVVVEPNCVSTLEDMISPTSDVKLPAPDSVQPDSAVALVAIEDKLSSAETYQPGSVRNSIQNSVPTSGAIIDGADNSAASGTQFSTGQNLSKRPTPVTHNGRVDGPPELEAQFTTRSKSAPDVSVGSFATSTVYGEQAAEACCTDEQTVEASIVVEQHALRELRNVDEAKLESHQGISQKRMKLNDGTGQAKRESGAPVQSAQVLTGDKVVQTESDATGEARDDQRMRKFSRSALQRAVRLGKGENPDKAYARRTISFLVKLCCRFTNTCPEHVMSLCQVLVSAYRKLRISPMLVVRGSLSVFRTPRSRRLMQESELGLSWLCNQVLIRVMCNDSEDLEHDGSIAPESLSLSLVDVCLLHLRGLLLEERTSVGDFLSDDSPHVHVATRSNITSHDIVFLAQTCALYTHLCRSSGRLFASRVLLFDLVRENPNIRGLHFARVMLEIYPAMLEREFDQHCVERQQILRETLQQALVFISSVSAAKQELLLHQASTTMLHAIAGALQMPELEEVDGNDPSLPRAHVEKLFGKVSVHCRSSQPRLQDDVVQSPVTAEHFALAKSMELCAAVYGLDLVTEVCSIDRCQELYNETNVENKIGIMYIVSHIATTFFSKTCDTQTSKTGAQQYVDDVVEWMYHVLSTDTTSSPEDHHKLMLGCATVCVDLVLEFPSPAGFEARRRALCAVVHWFDTIPSDKLIDLPATFLRRLRLAVVAARPHAIGK